MSILSHPEWPLLRPLIRIERYGRDTGRNGARVRLEVDRPSDGVTLRTLLALQMRCVSCGRMINPVRSRHGASDHLYFAATCGLDMTYACARGSDARDEYLAVRKAVEAWQATQPAQIVQSDLPLED